MARKIGKWGRIKKGVGEVEGVHDNLERNFCGWEVAQETS